jgi:hypothetical protein
MEILSLHPLQRPRSTIQLRIGTFSLALIWCPHFGHRERGLTTDSPSGHLPMQTLRNDPIAAPTTKT